VNTPIQGSSADIIKIAMVRIENRLRKESLKAKMLLQVHDELLFEVPEEERERVAEVVKEEMEGACPLESGLAVELAWGKNWKEAK
jgi:DNA polymerase-1